MKDIKKVLSSRKLVCLIALFLMFFTVQTVFATTISPPRVEVYGNPGDIIKGEILLFNKSEEERQYLEVSYENFVGKGESGFPSFTGSDTGMATWIESEKEVTISPSSVYTMPFSISIPEDATPGGHYAAIFFEDVPNFDWGDNTKVIVGTRVGSLVFLHINGYIPEDAFVSEFSIVNGEKFFSKLPVIFFYRLQNGGGDKVKPKGVIKIKSIFRTKVTLNANIQEGNVLNGSIRRFEIPWGDEPEEVLDDGGFFKDFFGHALWQMKNFAFGYYTAVLDIEYGSQSEVLKYSFFVLPWQLLIIVFIILIILIIAWRLYRRNLVKRIEHQIKKDRK